MQGPHALKDSGHYLINEEPQANMECSNGLRYKRMKSAATVLTPTKHAKFSKRDKVLNDTFF